ncbi:hypothetical protein J4Q44_G00351060 [Coregonus suidteri]|uniref:Uncharacterized protein n=1 Tax=Coregonus suidteri TaxID=861788 RepID=A0AAN8QC31_9TELE
MALASECCPSYNLVPVLPAFQLPAFQLPAFHLPAFQLPAFQTAELSAILGMSGIRWRVLIHKNCYPVS